jgi:type I restriction enzyme S subunit
MIADLKPYPAMRDSGVPWLGDIPAHWELRRKKTVLRERVDKGHPNEPLLAATQSKGVVRKEQYQNRTVLALKDLHLLKLVRVGDFVISLRSFQGGIEYAHEQGIISPAYTILYPVSADTFGYLARLFKSAPYIDNLSLFVTGIRQGQNIDYEKLGRAELPLPPLPEQAAIVRFLDHYDRKIRRYIRAKRKLIKLLEEQEQAIIHRAVTRGLDPNVRLKPSGVEWLGDIPAHWKQARLKDAAVVQTGVTLGKDYRDLATQSYPYLRVANVQVGRVDLDQVKRIEVPPSEAATTTLRAGDVLMTEGGDIDKLGRGCVWNDEIPGCLHQNHIFAVRCRQDVLFPEFLVGLMASLHGRTYFQLTAKQTTNLASTNSATLRAFPIILPPLAEQQAILYKICNQTRGIEQTMDETSRAIDLLFEYRTRLIADVVTGKLDVREAAARLPEDVEETDTLDGVGAEVPEDHAPEEMPEEEVEPEEETGW